MKLYIEIVVDLARASSERSKGDYPGGFVFDFQLSHIVLSPLCDVLSRERGPFSRSIFLKNPSVQIQYDANAELEY